ALQMHGHIRLRGDVAAFDRLRIGRKHEQVVEPETPDRHRVRTPILPRGRKPVVACGDELSAHRFPRHQAFAVLRNAVAWYHRRTIADWLAHSVPYSASTAVTRSCVYPNTSLSTVEVCSPGFGGKLRTVPGVSESLNGVPVIATCPYSGCGRSTNILRA